MRRQAMEPVPLDGSARDVVEQAVARFRTTPGGLLPALHAVQDALGFIPDAAVALIAAGLNLSRAEVHGVVSFYHYFRREPAGRHTVQLCRAEACQSMRARDLEAHAKSRLGIDFHQTDARRTFTLEPVYCLGNCALSPAMMVDGEIYGRVSPARFDAIVADWENR